MDPSLFVNSQMTADGLKPARDTISIAASVCPGLAKIPPQSALRGNTCPGLFKSLG